ncbi:flagellar basal-body MS-ring/collar protein FliF [Aestuariibius sp. 2305UL40-4]|uniref:flagellar basal-body MS-ring/collar protein FliF n=1 Tax=Aestuariibius violaceus TaxID=3234132 RepID=UPI00345E767F
MQPQETDLVQNIAATWQALDPRRRIVVIVATLAVFAIVVMLGRGASRPDFALLYAGLDGSSAGQIITALDQRGVTYEVRGDSIFVDQTQRDSLRMTLAGEGLPANSAQGYELLDSLSGFGTTSQMFDAAYWRAKEGELARTIVASSIVQTARVHISNPSQRPFDRSSRPTAAVTVTTAAGTIAAGQANALRYLVASAVSGLSPEDVAVIDSEGGLIARADEPGGAGSGDRAARLRDQVTRLLEARVGYGNAVVEVSLDTVTETESITERIVDPASRVAISTDTEERAATAQNSGAGSVTVASNLPDGEAGGSERSSSNNDTETRERVNFEISETQREVLRVPGAVKRLTVAVLVNGLPDASGADGTPRPDAELDALRELVASAVGYDEARGDVITIKSMAFQPVVPLGSEPGSGGPGLFAQLNIMQLIQLGVLALVALVLGLFVLRPILAGGKAPPELPPPARLPRTNPGTALTGEIDTASGENDDLRIVSGTKTPAPPALPPADPVERLKTMIGERQDDTVEVLRNWIDTAKSDETA